MGEYSLLTTKLSHFSMNKTLSVAALILITFYGLWSFTYPQGVKPRSTSHDETFYDDPEVGYTIDKPITNWDHKRAHWLHHNPSFPPSNALLMVTGSQPSPCNNPSGDHLLLRFFKNKVDYCRIHGYQIYYNNVFMQPEMQWYWAKAPILRAAMVAHPEVEWLFWVDSDAVFTDMKFQIPFERYKDHNLVVYGWPHRIYEEKSWVSLNAGVFLLRNCQWALDFLDAWVRMGPMSPDHANWGKILKSTLSDMSWEVADDQSAMVYMLLEGKKWRDSTYVENQYLLSGYWLFIVDKYDDDDDTAKIEKRVRRHAEAARYLTAEDGRRRRPFVTHFTGCAPCSGKPNPMFEVDSCRVGMEKALNFADNQILRNYGFVHPDIGNGSHVSPLTFDYDI
ncbi:hypothetical protein ACS0TY_019988 [Phlomoides rotata]